MTRSLITCANRTGRAVLLFGAVIAVLGIVVALIEGWSIGEGLWWAEITASTVGYGDLSPTTLAGRLIAGLLVIPIGLVGIGVIVGRVAASVIETKDAWKDEEQEQVKSDLAAIRAAVATLVQHATITSNLQNPKPDRTLHQRLRDVIGSTTGVKAEGTSKLVPGRLPTSTSSRRRDDDRRDDSTADDGTSSLLMYGGYAATTSSLDDLGYGDDTSGRESSGGDGGANAYQPDTSTPAPAPYTYDGGASYDPPSSSSSSSYDSGSSSSYSSSSYDSGSSSSSSYDSGSSGGGSFGD